MTYETGKLPFMTRSDIQELRLAGISLALQKMFKADWFCISTINRCAESVNIIIDQEIEDILRTFHCVHWSAMSPDIRKKLMVLTLSIFTKIDIEEQTLRNFSREGIYSAGKRRGQKRGKR